MIGNSEAVNAPEEKETCLLSSKKAAEKQTEQLVFTHIYEIS
ncbi:MULTISPECIES: hypothetical protein [Priestia]|uniref:Uncharacterized protein n=1 Tax=Priestia megaterium (strain WSH-002) TaxID=1006007 RepID=A0A8D4BNN0_PRIMW|nr:MULTISPECIES: hypothetical protein [Priestia]AEN89808.1 hypothetical protein BMWSH_2926 [Priestia megaterium WSH-002]MDN3362477.1 hypothetical protein [Priestia megaterium]WKU21583.1 hypothetical protein Q3A90_17580 [Priestia megaterium]